MPDKAHSHPEPYRMHIPRPPRYGCVVGCATFGCFPLVIGTFVIAIFNLMHSQAIIASVLWLALVAFMLWLPFSDEDPRKVAIKTIGGFSFHQFAEVERREGRAHAVNFGYTLFGESFYELRIPAEDVWWVNWSTGQATDRAGKDMNDWIAWIWYRDDHDPLDHGRNLHMIGFAGAKEPTEAFGRRFVDFLKEGGIELLWDEHEQEFATPNAPSREANRQS